MPAMAFPNPPTGRLGIVHFYLLRDAGYGALKSPNRQVGDRSFQPTERCGLWRSQIPQPAGWGLFISAYREMRAMALSNPPTGRLGIVHFSLLRDAGCGVPESPNRQVGDRSFQPTERCGIWLPNPPTGRLGIVHFCLCSQAYSLCCSKCPARV
jgi:hypothetical protein